MALLGKRLPIPPPLISQIASVLRNHKASPPIRRLSLVPPPASCGEERHIKHHRMDDALSGIHRTSLEPRGGIEPPRPRRRSHGCGPVFCYCTRHICRLKNRANTNDTRSANLYGWFSTRRLTELHSLGATLPLVEPARFELATSTPFG